MSETKTVYVVQYRVADFCTWHDVDEFEAFEQAKRRVAKLSADAPLCISHIIKRTEEVVYE